MTQREKADVDQQVLWAIEKEEYADQEQQMIVTGDHMFRAEIQKRDNRNTLIGYQNSDDEILLRLAPLLT